MKSYPIPPCYELKTADQIAETVDYHRWLQGDDARDLHSQLWCIQAECRLPTPLGGDGSAGTVETPDGRLNDENDDKTPHWWNRLSTHHQAAIIFAALVDDNAWLEGK